MGKEQCLLGSCQIFGLVFKASILTFCLLSAHHFIVVLRYREEGGDMNELVVHGESTLQQ